MDYTVVENQVSLKERLTNETLLVSFTKANGERRDMQCTLNPSVIPASNEKKEATGTRPSSITSLPVYDVNAKGWRSFRWDSILNVSTV